MTSLDDRMFRLADEIQHAAALVARTEDGIAWASNTHRANLSMHAARARFELAALDRALQRLEQLGPRTPAEGVRP